VVGGTTDGYSPINDISKSTDMGATWTPVGFGRTGWSPRFTHGGVLLPDGSIWLMGGYDGMQNLRFNDVWRSPDGGVTWDMVTESAPWDERQIPNNVVAVNDRIILIGGDYKRDVWECYTQTGTNSVSGNIYVIYGQYGRPEKYFDLSNVKLTRKV
jgi:hypothetical protein